jgi:hypothetical protein
VKKKKEKKKNREPKKSTGRFHVLTNSELNKHLERKRKRKKEKEKQITGSGIMKFQS